ncbi:hypothetical protein [Dyella acidiphila]|uniref:Uncharacterized protein n=1 Tax=Dyella acidiphila TaxID=2775866 RepID=A0ABR9G972_9GAMM|nr:hypothetical protein [Dyella acidiphila]MBE1160568.1 hypothetical protein [Dyella acidiphila]
MSKIVTVVILLAAAGFATALRAAPQNVPPAPLVPAAASSAASPGHASPLKPGDRNCIRDTGSLIPPKPGQCLPVAGRSYSKDELDSTGKMKLGPELQQLDPSVTLQRH